jgi:ribonuclease BN (tRNA processing enzyme)
MRLTVVGSGDAFGSGGRFNTCFLVRAGQTLLIDCGASSPVALKRLGIDPNAIDGVLLSHLHGDHFGGIVFLLIDGQYLGRRERPFTIAGPPGTRMRVEAALEAFFPRSTRGSWRFPWTVIEIPPGKPCDVLGVSVETAEVIHFSGAPSTAVRVSDRRSVLAYSGDTEWTEALVPIAAGSDLFIVECFDYARALNGHMAWSVLKPRLRELKARRVMITHMNPTMLAHLDEARAAGVLVAEDGLTMEV